MMNRARKLGAAFVQVQTRQRQQQQQHLVAFSVSGRTCMTAQDDVVSSTQSVRNITTTSAASSTCTVAEAVPLHTKYRDHQWIKTYPRRMWLSTTTSTSATGAAPSKQGGDEASNKSSSSSSDGSKGGGKDDNKSSTFSDYFFDNLGKIFLVAIASIIGTLIRGSYNTSNRNKIRDWIETTSALDPLEIDDLRVANSEFTSDVFVTIMDELYDTANPTGGSGNVSKMTYPEFVSRVRKIMIRVKGDAYTIQLGHLLDRVVASLVSYYATAKDNGVASDGDALASNSSGKTVMVESNGGGRDAFIGDNTTKTIDELELPISLWLTVLSLALNASSDELIQLLYQVLQKERQVQQQEQGVDTTSGSASNTPTLHQVVNLVGYLQQSCQLVPDTLVIDIPEEYIPTQQYKCATAQELVETATHVPIIAEEPFLTSEMSLDDFTTLLTTKPVCAWGECYQKARK